MPEPQTIWKFPLTITDEQEITVQEALVLRILTLQVQREVPCLWLLVIPKPGVESRIPLRMIGTGHLIEELQTRPVYLGTFQIRGGALVFHVFQGAISVVPKEERHG